MLLPLSSILVLAASATLGLCASLVQVKDFGGSNPTKINMYIYVPDKVATKPAVIVAVSNPFKLCFKAMRRTSLTTHTVASMWWQRTFMVQRHQTPIVRRQKRLHLNLPRHSQHEQLLGCSEYW